MGNKITALTSNASSLTQKLLGSAANAAGAGLAFETLLETGLNEVKRVTNGVSDQSSFSLPRLLLSGGFGAVLGGALGAIGTAYEFAPLMVQQLLQAMGEMIGLEIEDTKLMTVMENTEEAPAMPEVVEGEEPPSSLIRSDDNTFSIKGRTKITIMKGDIERFAVMTPIRGSLTLYDVSKWYQTAWNQAVTKLDKTLTLDEQIKYAEDFQKQFIDGAVVGLRDQKKLEEIFQNEFRRVPAKIEAALRAEQPDLTGTALKRKVLEKLTAPIDTLPFYERACFVAGTPVWTDKGLVPIEQIKVGDMVLSQPEIGAGVRAYKRVVKTHIHEDKNIRAIEYTIPIDITGKTSQDCDEYVLFATDDHPFWVKNQGWTAAIHLESGQELEMAGGIRGFVWANKRILTTDNSSIGLVYDHDAYDSEKHYCVEFDQQGQINYLSKQGHECTGHGFRHRVYNIEVEDFHTYFVGEEGVWVHNSNCDGAALMMAETETSKLPPAQIYLYYSEEELKKILNVADPPSDVFYVAPRDGAKDLKEAIELGKKIDKDVLFEDEVEGRLVLKGDPGMRLEYAVPYDNTINGPFAEGTSQQGLNWIMVEGHREEDGYQIFIDRKLSLGPVGAPWGITARVGWVER
ncbi:polymorphic toxin-type HINT domain-containing protein [Methylomagnum sp.]